MVGVHVDTRDFLKIKLRPCHLTLFAYNELVILKGGSYYLVILSIMLMRQDTDHRDYENKFWHNIDRNYVRIWILYCIWKFWECMVFRWHLLGVACVFPFITTPRRDWNNLPRLLPHMTLHLLAGRGIILSLESLCSP